MKKLLFPVLALLLLLNCGGKKANDTMKAQGLIDSLTQAIEPLNKAVALASWNASTTGEDKYYAESAEISIRIDKILSDKIVYEKLKSLHDSPSIKDPLLKRQVESLYLGFLSKQVDEVLLNQITELQTRIEQKFNTFRSKIDGREYSGNDLKEIFQTETNNTKRKAAWEASKQVGPVIAEDVIRLVKLKNEAARQVGFDNYYEMQLIVGEQDPDVVLSIFDELDEATREPYLHLKSEIDAFLAARYGIKVTEMKPWHYADPFFQEAPVITPVSLDKYYKDQDVVELARKFYSGIGLNVESILDNSDLYERDKKYPHAFCTNIDRKGDVRIIENVRPNESWMATTLHELGHGVYDLYLDPDLPYFLRQPAHSFTTEGVAMFFEKMSKNPEWMQQMIGISDEEKEMLGDVTQKTLKIEQMVFSRWSQVMMRFERALYENPDQDLNSVWWDLVEKYQMVSRPENRNMPDWAAKIHIDLYPAYYHNYTLGALQASQLMYTIAREQGLESIMDIQFANNPEIGQFFLEKIFKPGNRYPWNEMIERATGEKLTAKYFVMQFGS